MPARAYQTWTHTGPGGTFTLRMMLPPTGADVRAALPAVLGPVAAQAAVGLVGAARQAYPLEPLAGSFQPVSRGTFPVQAGVTSADPLLPFIEFNTRPHWPPAGPTSRLAGWVARTPGAPPARVVARLIASRGTWGRYVMEAILQAAAPRFAAALVRAVTEALRAL